MSPYRGTNSRTAKYGKQRSYQNQEVVNMALCSAGFGLGLHQDTASSRERLMPGVKSDSRAISFYTTRLHSRALIVHLGVFVNDTGIEDGFLRVKSH